MFDVDLSVHFFFALGKNLLSFFFSVSSPVSTLSLCVHVENMCAPSFLFCLSDVITVSLCTFGEQVCDWLVLLPYPSSF